MESILEKETIDNRTMDIFDRKLTEADEAINNGARYYTRDEVNTILDMIMKK